MRNILPNLAKTELPRDYAERSAWILRSECLLRVCHCASSAIAVLERLADVALIQLARIARRRRFLRGSDRCDWGWGGLFTVPALLTLGLDPHAALATNKGQASFRAVSSPVTSSTGAAGLASGFVDSLPGVELVSMIPPAPLRPLVLGLLFAAACAMLLHDRLIHARRPSTTSPYRCRAKILVEMGRGQVAPPPLWEAASGAR